MSNILNPQSRPSGTGGNLKRMPSYECPSTATEIRRVVAGNLRQYNHGDFYCYYMSDPVTFILPNGTLIFPIPGQVIVEYVQFVLIIG